MKSNCGCKDDSLCKEGKKLWRMTSIKGRVRYSYHRVIALGVDWYSGYSIRANNVTPDGIKLKTPTIIEIPITT